MKFTVVFILVFASFSAFSQQKNTGLDSLMQVQVSADTFNVSTARLDSLHTSFQAKADSIAGLQQKTLGELSAKKAKLTHSIDSLQSLNLPTGKYVQQKDSITQVMTETVKKYQLLHRMLRQNQPLKQKLKVRKLIMDAIITVQRLRREY